MDKRRTRKLTYREIPTMENVYADDITKVMECKLNPTELYRLVDKCFEKSGVYLQNNPLDI